MSKTIRNNDRHSDPSDGKRTQSRRRRDRDITLRPVRRRDPDLRRMGRALIALAIAEAEAEAAERHANPDDDSETKQPDPINPESPDVA